MMEEVADIVWRSKDAFHRFQRWFYWVHSVLLILLQYLLSWFFGTDPNNALIVMLGLGSGLIIAPISLIPIDWFLRKLYYHQKPEDMGPSQFAHDQLEIWMNQTKVRFQILLIVLVIVWIGFAALMIISNTLESFLGLR